MRGWRLLVHGLQIGLFLALVFLNVPGLDRGDLAAIFWGGLALTEALLLATHIAATPATRRCAKIIGAAGIVFFLAAFGWLDWPRGAGGVYAILALVVFVLMAIPARRSLRSRDEIDPEVFS